MFTWLPIATALLFQVGQDATPLEQICERLFQSLPTSDAHALEAFTHRAVPDLVALHHHAESTACRVVSDPSQDWQRKAIAIYVLGEMRSAELYKYLGSISDHRLRIVLLRAILKRDTGDEVATQRQVELDALESGREDLQRLSLVAGTTPSLSGPQQESRLRFVLERDIELLRLHSPPDELASNCNVLVRGIGHLAARPLVEMTLDSSGDSALYSRLLAHLAALVNAHTNSIGAVTLELIFQAAARGASHQDVGVRRSAVDLIWEFWKLGDQRAPSWLERLSNDADEQIRRLARLWLAATLEPVAERRATSPSPSPVDQSEEPRIHAMASKPHDAPSEPPKSEPRLLSSTIILAILVLCGVAAIAWAVTKSRST